MSKIAARVLLGLPGLFILLTGIVFLTNPTAASEKLMLTAEAADGFSNLRGMAGAPLFAVGVSLVLAAITTKLEYARPGAIFLLVLIVARVASYVFDGPTGQIGLYLAVPSCTFALMALGHWLLVRSEPEGGEPAVERRQPSSSHA